MSKTEFVEFYQHSKDRCLQALVAAGLRPDEVEDAAAEAFAKAWSRWESVRHHDSPEAWVVRTALNANISRWRRRRRETTVAVMPELSGTESSDRVDLVAAVRRLPRRQREVVVLRYLLDLDTAQTAARLGISPGTVASQLHHAISALRSHLTEPEGINS